MNRTARCIYIGIQWNDCLCSPDPKTVQAWPEIRDFINNLDRSFCYFTVSMNDDGFQHFTIPPDLRILIFDAGGGVARQYKHSYGNKITVIPIPLLKQQLHPRKPTKAVLGTFVGRTGTGGNRTAVRPKLAVALQRVFEFHEFTDGPWQDLMEQGHFTLCPRGFGETSYRLYEAIQLEVLPIYVWDRLMWLPYQELLDWSHFAIVVEAPFIHTIERRVREAQIERMTVRLRQVKHMFTNDYICRYITDIVQSVDFDA